MKKRKMTSAEKAAAASRRAVAGMERDRFFANGGTPKSWNGGSMWTAKDQKAESSRSACRGRHFVDE